MTESMTHNNQPRTLQPRRLEQQESLHSINHWRSVFRNFYRRCPYYGIFLLPTTTWDSSATRGFTQAETTGLKRDPATLAADLEGFLDCVGSYCPFDYVGEKLKNETNGIKSVWDALYEIYDLEITTSNFMDYALMHKDPEESYRSYFNRLVGFVRQHLPTTEKKAEGVSSLPTGDTLSISLLDTIAIHWLLTIDRRLISIVKTEFASDLKEKRLCQMVNTIAPNIDDLLVRYNTKDSVSIVATDADSTSQTKQINNNSDEMISLVNRVERLETNFTNKNRRKSANFSRKKEQCTHCLFINKQLGASLKTDHPSHLCGKKSVSISLLEVQSEEHATSSTDEDEGGKTNPIPNLLSQLQIDPDSETNPQLPVTCAVQQNDNLLCPATSLVSPAGDNAVNVSDYNKVSDPPLKSKLSHLKYLLFFKVLIVQIHKQQIPMLQQLFILRLHPGVSLTKQNRRESRLD